MPLPSYLQYWGKAKPADGVEVCWHPAAYHCLDVAAVGAALLDSRPQLLVVLARLAQAPPQLARSWFLFALVLHDVGKFVCCFQAKVEARFEHSKQWTGSCQLAADIGHGRTGYALWAGGCQRDGLQRNAFVPLLGNFDAHACFDYWVQAVAGHHGRPLETVDNVGLANRICQPALNDARAYIEDCAALFKPHVRQSARKMPPYRRPKLPPGFA